MSLQKIQNEEKSLGELIYDNASHAIRELMRQDQKPRYVSGKITGYFKDPSGSSDDKYYIVRLEDGRTGKIKCEMMDTCDKVADYRNGIIEEFVWNKRHKQEQDRNRFAQYINREYFFEITGEGSELELDIGNVKKDFIKYIVDNKCIVKGTIINIRAGNGHVDIEIPYGLIFGTNAKYVFGYKPDDSFDYTNYIGAEISLVISYDQNCNCLCPRLANSEHSLAEEGLYYIFPILKKWNGTSCSRLWLNDTLTIEDKSGKSSEKRINRLVLVRLMPCGFRGKIDKFFSKNEMPGHRKSILAIGWLESLLGYRMEDAIRYLEDKLFCYRICYQYSDDCEKDTIMSMSPNIAGKSIVPRNILIQLTVSQGKARVSIMPDLVGKHILAAQKELQDYRIGFRCVYNYVTMKVGNGCIAETEPPAGGKISSEKEAVLTVYQKESYETPFALRKDEFSILSSRSRIRGAEYHVHKLSQTPWQAFLLRFVLKHKIVASRHLRQAIELFGYQPVSSEKLKGILNYLQNIAFIGKNSVQDRASRGANVRFYYPRTALYAGYKDYAGYNGIFSRHGRPVRDYKIRSAENQAFLKLYDILKEEYDICYEVDWVQETASESGRGYIKVHMAVRADHRENGSRQVYFMEAVRFLMEDEQGLSDGWEKIGRYQKLIDRRYDITPALIVIFEDEEHFRRFMARKPDQSALEYMEFYYTWDTLTNSGELSFDKVFQKGTVG